MSTPYELVIVGGGNMGAALLGGLLRAGTVEAGSVAVAEVYAPRRAELAELFPDVTVVADLAELGAARSAVLAVKPYDIPAATAAVVASGVTRVLSIAAGVTIETIESAAGATHVAVLRAMPNTPALVGEGVSGLSAGAAASDDDVAWGERILSAVGRVVRVGEHQLDAVTGLTGSGPAYLFLIAEALIDAGVLAGLARPVVEEMVAGLFVGSSKLLAERGDPAALRAMVTSPGGTTAAGLHVLEARAVRAAIADAVQAATERSRQLGR